MQSKMILKRGFVSITDLTPAEILKVLQMAKELKSEVKKEKVRQDFKGKTLAMIFEKPSLRTRVSFEVGMTQLGGHAIYLGPSDIGLGKRESVADIAIVTSSMVDIIMARTFKHEHVIELAQHSSVPVINTLSDMEHPCQILADLMTIWEVKGKLKGLKVAYVGDCENNVTHSLALGCVSLGMHFRSASPKGYSMNRMISQQATDLANKNKVDFIEVIKPEEAVKDADVVITDTWVSMGDEAEKAKRIKIFKPYQVNSKLMSLAKKNAIFLHCLPAYRGNEVTSEVIDGSQSVVFQEAENRLHAQKALMLFLMGKKL